MEIKELYESLQLINKEEFFIINPQVLVASEKSKIILNDFIKKYNTEINNIPKEDNNVNYKYLGEFGNIGLYICDSWFDKHMDKSCMFMGAKKGFEKFLMRELKE